MPYRQEISWDQTYNDVYLLDVKTGKPKKVLEHWGNAATMSPGRQVRAALRREDRPLAHLPRLRRRARRTSPRRSRRSSSRRTTRRTCRAPYGTGGWTADDKSVLLYDKFDIWEVKPDGTGARMVTAAKGASRRSPSAIARFDPEEQAVPTNKPIMLSAVNDRTRATGFYRLPEPDGDRRRPRRS